MAVSRYIVCLPACYRIFSTTTTTPILLALPCRARLRSRIAQLDLRPAQPGPAGTHADFDDSQSEESSHAASVTPAASAWGLAGLARVRVGCEREIGWKGDTAATN